MTTPPSAVPDPRAALPFQTLVEKGTGRVFRRSAQGFVMNQAGLFLGCTPVGSGNEQYLQTVQGGMEQDETEPDTLTREFQEELGVDAREHLSFIAVIAERSHSSNATVCHDATTRDDARRAFRYASKSWRKLGVYGQQLCPSLFVADNSLPTLCVLRPRDPNVRQEFKHAAWVTLASLSERAPPAKKEVMDAIVPCVYDAALAYLTQYHPEACQRFERQATAIRRKSRVQSDQRRRSQSPRHKKRRTESP